MLSSLDLPEKVAASCNSNVSKNNSIVKSFIVWKRFYWWSIVEEVGIYIREYGLDLGIRKAGISPAHLENALSNFIGDWGW